MSALVVLPRGVNVGGHRRFRPTALAGRLMPLGAVKLGAAGTPPCDLQGWVPLPGPVPAFSATEGLAATPPG